MELVEVEITALVITARYGTLSTGDILKTDQAFADHLVNDCKGAKWPERTVVSADSGADVAADPTYGAAGEALSSVVDPAVPDPVAPAAQEKAALKPPKKAPK